MKSNVFVRASVHPQSQHLSVSLFLRTVARGITSIYVHTVLQTTEEVRKRFNLMQNGAVAGMYAHICTTYRIDKQRSGKLCKAICSKARFNIGFLMMLKMEITVTSILYSLHNEIIHISCWMKSLTYNVQSSQVLQ